MDLSGKVVLVVGGASGIGLATVQELLQEGANVVLGDVAVAAGKEKVEELQQQFGAKRIIFVIADVCSDSDLEAAFISTKQHFKTLDIFVNCAGIMDDFRWKLEVEINLTSIIRGTILAWKYMGKQEGGNGGAVINISSTIGLESYPGSPIYCATKHGVIGFGRSCGEPFHLQRTGVRVITVCPGFTVTPLVKKTPQLRQLTKEMEEESFRAMSRSPSQKAEDVARGIVHVIQHAESGSVWVREGDEDIYEVAFPRRQDLRVPR